MHFIRDDPNEDFYSLVIARNGHLILETYFNGHDGDTLHDIRSATKSLTSALVGIAIEEGLIQGVDSNVMAAFDAYEPFTNDGEQKREITVEHLLSMASGIDANVDDPSTPGYEDKMWGAKDWIRFAVDLPMARKPGEEWSYASVNTFLLGVFIEELSGMTLEAYAGQRLFEPIGITDYQWAETPNERTVAQGNLSVKARDMLKLGQLYLNDGRWGNAQIVPESWIRVSVEPRYPVYWDDYDSYGYGWYTHTVQKEGKEYSYYFASGNGGNKIYVLPDEQLVVAIQSAAYNTSYGQKRSLDVFVRLLDALTD